MKRKCSYYVLFLFSWKQFIQDHIQFISGSSKMFSQQFWSTRMLSILFSSIVLNCLFIIMIDSLHYFRKGSRICKLITESIATWTSFCENFGFMWQNHAKIYQTFRFTNFTWLNLKFYNNQMNHSRNCWYFQVVITTPKKSTVKRLA